MSAYEICAYRAVGRLFGRFFVVPFFLLVAVCFFALFIAFFFEVMFVIHGVFPPYFVYIIPHYA